jgi:hypothetical protein
MPSLRLRVSGANGALVGGAVTAAAGAGTTLFGTVGAVVDVEATPVSELDDDPDDRAQMPNVTVAATPANMKWRRERRGS